MSTEWVDGFARSLVQRAARSAPPSLSERLEEEWLADFEGRRRGMARLRFGVGCCWATRVIAHEFLEPKVAAAGAATATGNKVMSAYAQPELSFLSRRTTAFVAIIGLHALIIYGFATGLTHRVFVSITKPMISRVIVDPPKVEVPPPLMPQPTFTQPRQIEVPPTEPRFQEENSGLQEVITAQPQIPPAPPTAAQPQSHVVSRVLGGPGKSFPNTDDYYPPAEIRMGRKGHRDCASVYG